MTNDLTINIGGATGHLHILINPASHELSASAAAAYATGYSILFDEHDQIIYVGGKPYKFKTLTTEEYASIKSSVLDAAATGSLASQITNINNIIGTIEGPSGATSVQGALGELQSEIEALQTGVADLQTDVAGVSGALQTAISTLNTQIAGAASGKITSVNGLTGNASGAVVVNGKDIAWATGAEGEISVAAKFGEIDTSINTITGALGNLTTQVSQFASGAELKLYGADGTSAAETVTVGDTFYLKQGGATIATFDIEKDSFVREGTLVYGPTGGLNNGNAPDENESATISSSTPDPYLKLIINTSDAASGATGENYVYIPAKKLVDVYKGTTGTHIDISVDENKNISATVKAGSITGAEIATGAVNTVNIADNAVTAGKIATGAVTADKIAAGAVTDDKISIAAATETGTVTSGDAAATGAAQAASGATASSYVAVVNMASVSTTNAQVSDVTVGTTYADAYGAAAAVLGGENDATSAATVYGAKNYASGAVAEAKTDLIGADGDDKTANTINGAKAYADNVASNAAGDVISWTIIEGNTGAQG